MQLRAVSVAGHDTAHATYGNTLLPAASVPAAHDASHDAVPWSADATNSAQLYRVISPRKSST